MQRDYVREEGLTLIPRVLAATAEALHWHALEAVRCRRRVDSPRIDLGREILHLGVAGIEQLERLKRLVFGDDGSVPRGEAGVARAIYPESHGALGRAWVEIIADEAHLISALIERNE